MDARGSNPWQQAVAEFHEKLGHTIGDGAAPAIADARLRAKLLAEETAETIGALGFDVMISIYGHRTDINPFAQYEIEGNQSLVEAIDGLCDIIYVAVGAAVTMGVDLDPFFNEVQRSNMAKAGGEVRADGKRLKPEGWTPPDIAGVLARETGA